MELNYLELYIGESAHSTFTDVIENIRVDENCTRVFGIKI